MYVNWGNNKSYQEKINIKIGELIKLIQYIEWNLCLQLDIDGFANITLGQIKTEIIDNEILDEGLTDDLISILERRNDLIHQYFKRLDFNKHSENRTFLNNQLRYLSNFLDQVQKFNDYLCQLEDD